AHGYVSELWDFTRISVAQNNLQELREIWDQWNNEWVAARVKQKGDSKCIPWRSLRDAILTHPDVRKRLDVFALSIYGLVVFPKPLGHVDETVTDLFDQLDKKVTPILVILAETFRCGNFYWVPLLGIWGAIGYAPLLVLRQYRSR
ncbi:hypothetical protein Gotur_030839, partial [Gossypium turneri]